MVVRSSSGPLPEAASLNNTGSVVDAAMASGSRSPQPLHNFTLPDDLKWSFNPSPRRFRKPMLPDSPSPQRTDEEVSSERKSNKILLRLSNADDEATASEPLALSVNGEDQHQTPVDDGVGDEWEEGSEAAPKTWNLRPRKTLVKKQPSEVAIVPKGGTGEAQGKLSLGQSRAMGNNGKKRKKKKKEKEDKQKLYVSLSRQEIEEDIFAMTGSKPSRRPKKRTKAVQKLVDNLFPGLWSYTISPDAYRVSDPTLKN